MKIMNEEKKNNKVDWILLSELMLKPDTISDIWL